MTTGEPPGTGATRVAAYVAVAVAGAIGLTTLTYVLHGRPWTR